MSRESGFVCFANVHMTIEAHKDPGFRKELDSARLVLADGRPIAAACNWLYKKKQERIAGMDFMPAILQKSNEKHAGIFLYGSTEEIIAKLIDNIHKDYPAVRIAGAISPPFRSLSTEEVSNHISQINESGANFILVALGCPKQEKWMAANFQSIRGILLGLGGAFNVVAGIQKRSPRWMQHAGLEWLYRLWQEPKRLFKRYFVTNTLFAWLMVKEFFRKK